MIPEMVMALNLKRCSLWNQDESGMRIFLKNILETGKCTWGKSMSLGMISVTGFKEQSNEHHLATCCVLQRGSIAKQGWISTCRMSISVQRWSIWVQVSSNWICKALQGALRLDRQASASFEGIPQSSAFLKRQTFHWWLPLGETLGCYFCLLPSLKCPSPRVTEFVHTTGRWIGKRQILWCPSQFVFHETNLCVCRSAIKFWVIWNYSLNFTVSYTPFYSVSRNNRKMSVIFYDPNLCMVFSFVRFSRESLSLS